MVLFFGPKVLKICGGVQVDNLWHNIIWWLSLDHGEFLKICNGSNGLVIVYCFGIPNFLHSMVISSNVGGCSGQQLLTCWRCGQVISKEVWLQPSVHSLIIIHYFHLTPLLSLFRSYNEHSHFFTRNTKIF